MHVFVGCAFQRALKPACAHRVGIELVATKLCLEKLLSPVVLVQNLAGL